MFQVILAVILSFLLSTILMPLIKRIFRRQSFSQTILKYVEEHSSKQGTLTMGGVVFFITTLSLVFFFLKFDRLWFFVYLISLSFALIGGMDDFLKIHFKRNLGLKSYQKIIGQLGVAIILGIFVYFNVGTSLNIPFFNTTINLGWGIILVVILTALATTNSVNLTDGLDGLAGSVVSVVLFITILILPHLKETSTLSSTDYQNLSVLTALFLGSILGFLLYNTNKASIFMGDVGSLGLGGFISAVYIVTGLELSLMLIGICFVASSLSVIIQVFAYKRFKKRVFKMSPLHHHFQQSGFSEAKITFSYSVVTLIFGLILVLSYL